METLAQMLSTIDKWVWGPFMLIFLVGTGVFLTIRTRFLVWRNLGSAIRDTFGKSARNHDSASGKGDISPFASLTTALAATIGTGNIAGVATAMVAGGPGALIWMIISASFGMTTQFSECMLAIKYRSTNQKGEMTGGPMYTMKHAFRCKWFGSLTGWLFALFTVIASLGIGNLTQGNSISIAMKNTFSVPEWVTGAVVTLVAFIVLIGGIQTISKVSQYLVPIMASLYLLVGLIVILGNYRNLPNGILMIFRMAFSVKSVGGGLCGTLVVSMFHAMRFGIARGCFTNEAGMGSAAISASAAITDNPVRQGYISMTGTFWDTIVMCTITGLCIACSGVLGTIDPMTGQLCDGVALTIAAFYTVLGRFGSYCVCIGIALFAFSTILGWAYQGEKAFEYLAHTHKYNYYYRLFFTLFIYFGATTPLEIVWNFSDIANALMCIPNLICLLYLNKEIRHDIFAYEQTKKRPPH